MKRFTTLCLVSVLLASGLSASAATVYKIVSKTQGMSKGQGPGDGVIKGYADGEKAKMEFIEGGNEMTPVGAYMTTTDGGDTFYLVNPDEQSYMKWDMKEIMKLAGQAMKMVNMQVSEPKVEKLAAKKGEMISGYKTEYYKFRTSYVMSMSMFGMSTVTTNIQEEELWVTKELPEEALKVWLDMSRVRTGQEAIDRLVEAEMSKVKGFPLKRIVRNLAGGGNPMGRGGNKQTEMQIEVLDVKKGVTLPAGFFNVPETFTEQPSPAEQMKAQMQGQQQPTIKHQGRRSHGRSSGQPSKKKNEAGALFDLMKKKYGGK